MLGDEDPALDPDRDPFLDLVRDTDPNLESNRTLVLFLDFDKDPALTLDRDQVPSRLTFLGVRIRLLILIGILFLALIRDADPALNFIEHGFFFLTLTKIRI